MESEFTAADAKAGACTYLLHGLLQRLELKNPGLVLDLLEGVKGDQSAVRAQGSVAEPLERIFMEAIALLERCHGQNQMRAGAMSTVGKE